MEKRNVAYCGIMMLVVMVLAGPSWGVTHFDGSPGTAAPPATLGSYTMTPFDADTRPNIDVYDVPTPIGGVVGFSQALGHRQIGSGWATWSHGYTGDVYFAQSVGGNAVTLTMPEGIGAFYMYIEPNNFGSYVFEAVSDSGTTSGSVDIEGSSGAKYFGFYVDAGESLASIAIRNVAGDSGGWAVGEFGIAKGDPVVPEPLTMFAVIGAVGFVARYTRKRRLA